MTTPRLLSWPAARGRVPELLHLAAVLALFAGPLTGLRVLYFRDLSSQFFPDFVFVAGALRQGTWPLWNPHVDGGTPWLSAYPVDLVMLALGGARTALAAGPALHLLLALCGATRLGRRLGLSEPAAWLAGCAYGLSGCVLSFLNLWPLFEAAAWAPWAVDATLVVVAAPAARAVAVLGVLVALQVSTLGVEIVLMQPLVVAALLPRWPGRRALGALAGAVGIAALLASPAIVGTWALLQGTQRGAGFDPWVALGFSAHPVVLLEAVLPRLLGDPHTFSDVGYWGQPFFPEGAPYLVSLYLGPAVLMLAAWARSRRLWALVALGAVLSLGAYGPLAGLLSHLRLFRVPVKLFYLSTFALSLLAGRGFDRAAARPRGPLLLLPGAALLAAAALVAMAPDAPARALGGWVPALRSPLAREVVAGSWPVAFAVSGALATGLGLALARGRAGIAAALAVLDLLVVNAGVNPTAPAAFYALRPETAALLAPAGADPAGRWFSYGVANSPGLRWSPAVARQNADAWLFYMDRQTLLPRTQEIDGRDGVFDVDRTGWAPAGSTLQAGEATPASFRVVAPRLRDGGVRWVLSFAELPADLVAERGSASFPEIVEPLRVYEVRGALPRAFWSATRDGAPDPAVTVAYEPLGPHTVRVRAHTPPGFIVVLDPWHDGWHVRGPGIDASPLVARGRFRAWPTPGGEATWLMEYRPRWRTPALLLLLLGAAAAAGCAASRHPRPPAVAPDRS